MAAHLSLWAPNLWIPGETGQKLHHNPYSPAAQTFREFKPPKYAFETTYQRSYLNPSTWKQPATTSAPAVRSIAGGSYAQTAPSSPRRSGGDFNAALGNRDEMSGRLWRTTYQEAYPALLPLRRSVRRAKRSDG
jgi:hypothetical protein